MKSSRFVRLALALGLAAAGSKPLAAQSPEGAQPRSRAWMSAMPERGFLGVAIAEIDAERAKTLKLKEEAGVEITRVEEGSPAEKAGLKVGDVILDFNGQPVFGIEQFSRLVRETPVNREVKLLISRAGQTQTIAARVGSRREVAGPRVFAGPVEIPFALPDMPRSFLTWRNPALGIEGEAVDGQLAEYFGVKAGVLVRSVLKGSAAERAGLKAGDVLVKVGESKVAAPGDVSGALRERTANQPVSLVVVRERKEVTLSVTVDEAWPARRPVKL
jgi:serine protease Do